MKKQLLPFYNSPAEAIILIAVYLIATFVGAMLLIPFMMQSQDDPMALLNSGWFLLAGTAFPMLATLVFAFLKLDWRQIVKIQLDFSLPVFLFSTVAIILLGIFIDESLRFVPYYEKMMKWMEDLIQPSTGMLIAVVLFAPIFEEILFRGIILKTFLAHYSPRKSILLSALIFGLIHMHPLQAVGAFTAGILLGWLYWRTRSLFLVILLHAINNGIAAMGLFLGEGKMPDSLYDAIGNVWLWLVMLLAIPAVLYVLMIAIQKKTDVGPPPVPIEAKTEEGINSEEGYQ